MAAWTDEESTRLTELHAAGKSLSFIAELMDRSKDTISRHSERLGLSFSRAETAKAAEAKHVDNKARRARIEEQLLVKSEDMLAQLDEPAIVYSFGGQFNEYAEHELDKPDPVAQKHIVQALATALTAANKLHEMNAGHDATSTVSVLAEVHAAVIALANEHPEEPPTPTDEELAAEAET
ncbi:Helix-turn-helix domain-containing protein [Rhodococcus erythropolis]|uniref:Helix-turn-helix domain-containing protein n=2 Tax=Rhodococcus erythropolis TaxID=1833 RepID=A0A6G9CRT0_RHOER|nr:helix-turn-helix domain-containing protein [Rhodococcus erythropolis]QIP39696.1 Helix-turn-helix domain-containing protein [Rhodococcus erythropolis]QIP39755.1 Helix-turn-helix domain-containing protein [Rhodococcus erythropolis]